MEWNGNTELFHSCSHSRLLYDLGRCFSHLGRQTWVYSWEKNTWLLINKHNQRQSRIIFNLCWFFGLTCSSGKSPAQGIAHRGMTEGQHTLSQHGICSKLCQWRAGCYTLWPCPRFSPYITGKFTRDTEGIFRWQIWPVGGFFQSFKRRVMQSWFTVSQILSVKQE